MKNYFKKNKKAPVAVIISSLAVAFIIVSYVLVISPLNKNGKEFSIYIPTNNKGIEIEKVILDSLYKDAASPSIVFYKWKLTSLFKSVDKFPPGKY
ncbi:MAG: hypothetical protein ACKO7P_09925, partial [Bacteroidota bacterium]